MFPYRFGPHWDGEKTHFRLWAPGADKVRLDIEHDFQTLMHRAADGWHECALACRPGTRYAFRAAGTRVPDPASRGQHGGIHGQSVVGDPSAYAWQCTDWNGRPWEEAVFYEAHVGLCGGFAGLSDRLSELAALGITAVELMPVAAFPGARNWGYDGVLPFAPAEAYGSPVALKTLVDRAHANGLMVFLDVVYNHFGPDGNYLSLYAPQFFHSDVLTPWGPAIDFMNPSVARFFEENAHYWIHEFRFDGLRLDAVHAIVDRSWVDRLAANLRASVPQGRHVHIVLENERNDAGYLRAGLTAQWNDDLHHALHVILTGETKGYYRDFAEAPSLLLARALNEGFIYQGQETRTGERRGTSSADLPPTSFVACLQNHDQIGNRPGGERLLSLADPRAVEAAIALVLLSPQIPLIFMGEEIGSRAPFYFFADNTPELAAKVREGRRNEMSAFLSEGQDPPDPNLVSTFEASHPENDAPEASRWRAFYRRALKTRRQYLEPRLAGAHALSAHALGESAVLACWRLGDGSLLTIACNLGSATVAATLPKAPPIWGPVTDRGLPAYTTIAWTEVP